MADGKSMRNQADDELITHICQLTVKIKTLVDIRGYLILQPFLANDQKVVIDHFKVYQNILTPPRRSSLRAMEVGK